jgi:hypothetical protein
MGVESSRACASARRAGARAASYSRRRLVLHLVSLGQVVFVVVTGALWLALTPSPCVPVDSPPLLGVHLGMSLEGARAAFLDGAAGHWSSPPGCGGTTLEWSRGEAHAAQARWARFEFHKGVLVAIRVLSDATPPPTRHIEVTPAAVSETRAGRDGSTSTTVLARGCEMHRAEVRQLLAETRESSK